MAQLASFSPGPSSALHVPRTDASARGKQLLHWALLCARHCSVCPKTKGEGERHSPGGDGEAASREKGVR